MTRSRTVITYEDFDRALDQLSSEVELRLENEYLAEPGWDSHSYVEVSFDDNGQLDEHSRPIPVGAPA